MLFSVVGTVLFAFPSQTRRSEYLSPVVVFIVVLMPVLDCRLLTDCYSHVRHHCSPIYTTIFLNKELINVASIAIWKRNKVAVALAMTVWVVSIGFHLHSKSLHFVPSTEDL